MSVFAAGKLRVGVTLQVRDGYQSIWENGAFQNVVFLVQTLQQSPLVAEAVIVVTWDELPTLPPDLMLSDLGIRMVALPEAMQLLDVVVELSALLNEEWLQTFQAKGGRNVWMRIGNDYVIDIERAMFNLPSGSLCSRKKVAAVWTIPEYEYSCTDYFALTTRAPVEVLPHLWSPLFIDKGIAHLSIPEQFGYRPGRKQWRLAIAEPNVCMVKTSLVPIFVAETYYRQQPQQVEMVRVMNSHRLRKHGAFVQLMHMLDLVRHEAISFDDRIPLYELLAYHADVMISHHWENGQNYLYYEVLYGGYPLIHNSKFLRDVGYFYPDFNPLKGATALNMAWKQHDTGLATYRQKADTFLRTLDVCHEANVRAYTQALQRVMAN